MLVSPDVGRLYFCCPGQCQRERPLLIGWDIFSKTMALETEAASSAVNLPVPGVTLCSRSAGGAASRKVHRLETVHHLVCGERRSSGECPMLHYVHIVQYLLQQTSPYACRRGTTRRPARCAKVGGVDSTLKIQKLRLCGSDIWRSRSTSSLPPFPPLPPLNCPACGRLDGPS